jgi:hypothetical protein
MDLLRAARSEGGTAVSPVVDRNAARTVLELNSFGERTVNNKKMALEKQA